MIYHRRIIDDELDELLSGLAAVAIEGPKAVGKTATALERARTVHRFDDPAQASLAKADPGRLVTGASPILIDEWQRVPEVWDAIRRAVDEDRTPGRFLITGSASPFVHPTHSGAGRIVRIRLRPFSLVERELDAPTVSLRALLTGRRPNIEGETTVDLARYTEEIVSSGFPAIRPLPPRARRAQLESYISRVVDRDFEEMGRPVRKEDTLRRWIAAYAAATSTTATLEAIRDASSGGLAEKPARTTVTSYRDTLQRLWILDPVPAWVPSKNYFSRLAHPEKHHLTDPGLATILLGLDEKALLEGAEGGPQVPRDGTLLGHLFESLVTQSARVYAQAAEASAKHLRTKGGRHEVDLIVERRDGRVLAVEVKLGRAVSDADAKHLHWLREKVGSDLLDAVIVNTGPSAYRRPDGVAVVPAALLGP
jgi:predicted AAA+ superfamily ATPase